MDNKLVNNKAQNDNYYIILHYTRAGFQWMFVILTVVFWDHDKMPIFLKELVCTIIEAVRMTMCNIIIIVIYHLSKRFCKENIRPRTSVLKKNANTTFFALSSGEVEQGPAVGVSDLGRVALLQHLAHGVDIASCHRRLDLQLLL